MLLALLAKDLKRLLTGLLGCLLGCLLLQGLDPGGFGGPGIGFAFCLRLSNALLLLLLQLLPLLLLLLLNRNLLSRHLLLLLLLGPEDALPLGCLPIHVGLSRCRLSVSLGLTVVATTTTTTHGQTPILRPAPAAAGVPPVLIFRLLLGLSFLVTAAVV